MKNIFTRCLFGIIGLFILYFTCIQTNDNWKIDTFMFLLYINVPTMITVTLSTIFFTFAYHPMNKVFRAYTLSFNSQTGTIHSLQESI